MFYHLIGEGSLAIGTVVKALIQLIEPIGFSSHAIIHKSQKINFLK